jgi:phage terminase large subunit-like protein
MKFTTDMLRQEIERRRYNKLDLTFTDDVRDGYKKHMDVLAATADFRQVCMMAANRVGKSELGAYAVAVWATGVYPKWWKGKKFNGPINIQVAGETGKLVRDSVQKKLFGDVGYLGTGSISKEYIINTTPKAGTPNAIDTALIKHKSGGTSIIQFQSYDQGREAFQATERHVIWDDEEPPLEIYAEQLLRTMTTKGVVLSTFTPLKGVSDTVMHLQDQAEKQGACVVSATWDDAPHLGEDEKKELFDTLPPHQREARSKGVPSLGSGAIYPILEHEFVIDPIAIPEHWALGYGFDVGWNNTAACWGALDRDADVLYIYADYKEGQKEPAVHAAAIKARGGWIRGAIDPASSGRSQKDGQQLIKLYRNQGLNLILADNTVEAGIFEVYERLTTGRLKVFNTCTKFLEEYRLYRRDEKGRIVKQNDHIMDAARYLVKTLQGVVAQKNPPKPAMPKHPYHGGHNQASWMG